MPVPLPPQGPSPAAELPPCPGQSGHGPSGWAVCQAPWWVLSKQQGGVSGPLCCPQGWAERDGVGWAFAMLCSSLPTPRWHHHCGGMPGPRQRRSLGGRGALLAFGWDLCSLFAPGTPHSRCSAAPQPRAGRALAPLPRAIPSACAWGPRPGRAPPSRCPPRAAQPVAGEVPAGGGAGRAGGCSHSVCFLGPVYCFLQISVSYTEAVAQSKRLPGHGRALGSSSPRPPGFGAVLSISDLGEREQSASTGQRASPGPSRARGDELGAMGAGWSFIHFL